VQLLSNLTRAWLTDYLLHLVAIQERQLLIPLASGGYIPIYGHRNRRREKERSFLLLVVLSWAPWMVLEWYKSGRRGSSGGRSSAHYEKESTCVGLSHRWNDYKIFSIIINMTSLIILFFSIYRFRFNFSSSRRATVGGRSSRLLARN